MHCSRYSNSHCHPSSDSMNKIIPFGWSCLKYQYCYFLLKWCNDHYKLPSCLIAKTACYLNMFPHDTERLVKTDIVKRVHLSTKPTLHNYPCFAGFVECAYPVWCGFYDINWISLWRQINIIVVQIFYDIKILSGGLRIFRA